MRIHPVAALLLSSCLAVPWSMPAQAGEVRRCVTADGTAVFTDRRCEDVGAIDRLPRAGAHARAAGSGGYARGCSRSLDGLMQEVALAIGGRDVNRLAGAYLWTGISQSTARRIMSRLEDIVRRPLLDIAPVLPSPPPVLEADGTVADANADGYYPRTAGRQRPIGLRLEQTLTDGRTPHRTEFGLRRSHGCYWIGG